MLLHSFFVEAQTLISDFVAPSEVCLDEQLQLENTSTDANSYEWDFCFEDFSTLTPSFSSFLNSGLSLPFEARVIKGDTSLYVFIPSRSGNLIKYYQTSPNLDTIFSESTIEGISTFFQEPISIDVTQVNGNWIAYAVDFTQSSVYFLEFGSEINRTPAIQEIQLNSITLDGPTRVKVEQENDSIFLFISNFGVANLSKVVFNSSDLTSPMVEEAYSIPGASQLASFDILHYAPNQWIMLLGQSGTNNISRLKFMNSLNNTPVISNLITSGDSFTRPTGPQLFKEGDSYYSVLVNRTGEAFRLDFGTNLDNSPTVTNYGISTGSNASWSFDLVKNSDSRFVGLFTRFSSNLAIKMSFDDFCDLSPAISNEESPVVRFDSAGTKTINLKAFSASGEISNISKSLLVNSSTAPTGQFLTDSIYCISTSIPFQFNSSDNITSYNWDFGDGNSSSEVSPTYSYVSDGQYFVSLDVVSVDGCSNSFADTIRILPQPQPEFSTISSEFCTFETINFTNATSFDFGSNVIWSWDFNGEGTSSEENPSFSFDTPGTKTITLQADVLGCSESFQSTITIVEGPQPAFDFDKNCLGEIIQFNNLSSGTNITGYSWDFGNGESSTDENPQITYANPGNYTVTLTTSNATGCSTSTLQKLQVFEQVIDSIVTSPATENLPFLLGLDWDNSFDSTQNLTYEWEIEEQIQSSDTARYVLSAGQYIASLQVTTGANCLFSKNRTVIVQPSKLPTPSFNIPTAVCSQEQLQLVNSSVNANGYLWDFCTEDFSTLTPSFSSFSNAGLSLPFESRIIEGDTSLHVFIPNRRNNSINYYNASFDLESIFFESTLEGVSSIFQEPISLDVTRVNGNWIAYALDFTQSKMYFLDFGSELDLTPEIQEIQLNTITLDEPTRVKIEQDTDSLFVFISNFGDAKLSKAVFDNSDLISPIVEEEYVISGASQLASFDILEYAPDHWVMLLGQAGGNNLIKCLFEGSLNESPVISTVSTTGDPFTRPTGPQIFREGGSFYAMLVNRNGEAFRLDFDEDIESNPTVTGYGIATGSSGSWSLDLIKNTNSRFLGLFTSFSSNTALKTSFDDFCELNPAISNNESALINFDSPGTYPITLTAFHPNGSSASITKEITVTADQAPILDILEDGNLCVSNAKGFDIDVISGTISSYAWDVNGDGILDSDTSFVEFQYDSAARYPVRLDVVADNGCSNFVLDTVRVYDPPTNPQFDLVTDLLCEAEPVQLVNQFDASGYDDVLSYIWYDADQPISAARDTTVVVEGTGEKRFGLQVAIPGCTTAIEYDTIFINPTPQVDFSANLVCEGETTNFTNFSDPGTTYEWQFGDGFGSTTQNTTHTYADAGIYQASLRLVDANGCTDTVFQEVKVGAFPTADFDYGLVCDNETAQFTSSVELTNADAASYEWFRNGTLVTTLPDPSILIADSSEVRLRVLSTDGCANEIAKSVRPLLSPAVDFNFEIGCFEDPVVFQNQSNDIIDRQWTIDGLSYETDSVSIDFESAGSIPVQLTIQGSNLCTNEKDTTLFIPRPPDVRISAEDVCVYGLASFADSSQARSLDITARQWLLDGEDIGSTREVIYRFLEADQYELALQLQTEDGCLYGTSQLINVLPQPVADFDISSDYGVPGTTIDFVNNDPGAASLWKIFQDSVGTESNFSYNFEEPGNYDISLVSQSEAGCTDTTSTRILIANPEMDLKIMSLELVDDSNGNGRVFVTIRNEGNLPVEDLGFTISLEDQFTVRETVMRRINQMTENTVQLTAQVPSVGSAPAYLCISVDNPYGVADRLPLDNKECLTIDPSIVVERPYPNPVDDIVTIPVILPEPGNVQFTIYNQTGARVREDIFEQSSAGLSLFTMDLQNLLPGIYFVEVTIGNYTEINRIVVR